LIEKNKMSCYLCKSNKYSKRTGSVRDNPDIGKTDTIIVGVSK